MLRTTRLFSLLLILAAALPSLAQNDELLQGFVSPPPSARPHTWWHWMNGNVTREGIRLDLEEMARVGVGGAQIFDVDCDIPAGPVAYGTPEWRSMVTYALEEATRLGLDICLHNCSGWSSSGGPWVDPAHSMLVVVTSETRFVGPGRLPGPLPEPARRGGYYEDSLVLAFATPAAEAANAVDLVPTVTASDAGMPVAQLADGNFDTGAALGAPGGEDAWLQWSYPAPFTARSLTIALLDGQGAGFAIEASDDGTTFRPVARGSAPGSDITRVPTSVAFDPVTARVFRLVLDRNGRRPGRAGIAEATLSGGARLRDWGVKAGNTRAGFATDDRTYGSDLAIPSEGVRDLSDRLRADGTLDWEAPAGDWTVLRMGRTTSGKTNHPATAAGVGLECDKLSREALDVLFSGVIDKLIAESGPSLGKGWRQILVDSYEVSSQNWTPRLREEFSRLRGYDPTPWLPAMTGRIVGSTDQTERFLYDLRRTIADLYAENYWGYFREKCQEHGLLLATEPYGNGNFDDMQAGGKADVIMSEFWIGGPEYWNTKQCASIVHTYGKTVLGAEAFTASQDVGRWMGTPGSMKALGDYEYTAGINRFIFHRYAMQPWTDLLPGMTMGPWGTHFERTLTWWNQSPAWLTYLARCQGMLQSGRFAADLCYYKGDAPTGMGGLNPAPPAGYDWDACDTEVLLHRMEVRDGRLVLPDGLGYAALVLPNSDQMPLPVLERIRELVRAGATVVGPKPSRTPGLEGGARADARLREVADELWGACDGAGTTEASFGAGSIIWGKPLAEVLAARGLARDFEVASLTGVPNVVTIHRTDGVSDWWFVSNQKPDADVLECTFRAAGRPPEVWDPMTGKTAPAPLWREEGGRTRVTLRLEPAGSTFVVFRQPVPTPPSFVALEREGATALASLRTGPAHELTITSALYGVLGREFPDCIDVTDRVRGQVRDNAVSIPATNAFAGADPAANVPKQLRVDYTVDGVAKKQVVEENTTVTLPAEGETGELRIERVLYGLVPEGDLRPSGELVVDVTKVLQDRVVDGTLSVVAGNDLAGDPANLIRKQMHVEWVLDGRPGSRTVQENQRIEIPEGVLALAMPAATLERTDRGAQIVAWVDGDYRLTDSEGDARTFAIGGVPEPAAVEGPWTVTFPPNLGAPPEAAFPKLISWTESDDPGIRYFSGTATYRRALQVPADLLADGQRLLLDLGAIRDLAEVRLNGTDLGVLWTPPFRVDITDVARAGRNDLEVRVTNTWVNRLIGDDSLPPDAEYRPGGPIARWPEWLLEGKPRPETGRVTFTTWQHWTKDAQPPDSGLLGPVLLRAGVVREVEGGR